MRALCVLRFLRSFIFIEEAIIDAQGTNLFDSKFLLDRQFDELVQVNQLDRYGVLAYCFHFCTGGKYTCCQKDAAFSTTQYCAAKVTNFLRSNRASISLTLKHNLGSDEPVDHKVALTINSMI